MTQRTKAALATQISTLLSDNTSGDISESDVRSVFTDTKDSLVGGPTSATDNAVSRFDSTTGQLVQDSGVIIDDSNNVSGVGTLACGATTVTGALVVTSTLASGAATVTGAASTTTTITAGSYFLRSVGAALTAVGTTRTDALQLAKEVNNVTTAASGTGVILPVGVVGMRVTVFSNGANAIKVYASGSETIDGTAGSTGVTLTNTKRCDYFFTVANTWLSAQLGVVSA